MEFREFVEKAYEEVTLRSDIQAVYQSVSRQDINGFSDAELEPLFFERSWTSGGQTGGSCWGGEHYSRSADAPENITPDVAKVLKAVGKENITFVDYTLNIDPLVKSTEFSDNSDYYGNYSTYSRVYMNLKDLYDVLYGERDE